MGRLSTVSSLLLSRTGVPLALLGGLCGALLGCESNAATDAPKSRVQAVLAPSGEVQAVAAAAATIAKGPAKPRAVLCDGQLSRPGEAFTPKHNPEQVAAPGQPALPKDPLKTSGGQFTWLNFWAAWCAPCKQELPLLLGWRATLRPQLDIAFVSIDDDERQLRQYIEHQPDTGLRASYWLPDGPLRAEWLAALGLKGEPELPMQILIDPAGKVRCKVQGAVEAEDLATLRAVIGR
jgi:thiol-disulfide isomerase/thioredoxin